MASPTADNRKWQPKNESIAQRWETLQQKASDRPAHAALLRSGELALLNALEAGTTGHDLLDEVASAMAVWPLPSDVSARVADALDDDLCWLVDVEHGEPLPAGMHRSQFPNSYQQARQAGARAASARAATRERSATDRLAERMFGDLLRRS